MWDGSCGGKAHVKPMTAIMREMKLRVKGACSACKGNESKSIAVDAANISLARWDGSSTGQAEVKPADRALESRT